MALHTRRDLQVYSSTLPHVRPTGAITEQALGGHRAQR